MCVYVCVLCVTIRMWDYCSSWESVCCPQLKLPTVLQSRLRPPLGRLCSAGPHCQGGALKLFRWIRMYEWNTWVTGPVSALCFSLALLILTWKSQTPACTIPSLSWETLKEPRRLVGKDESLHPFILLEMNAEWRIRFPFVLLCAAVLCGGGLPPPVLSYHSVMVLQFASDSTIAHRGFSATLAFISHTGVFMV